jgi:hypothetical protein
MNVNQNPTQHRRAKRVGLALGVSAAGAMIAIGLGATSTSSVVAGSGDAPSDTTYSQPVPSAMNQGATATWSAPGTEPAVASASPTVKAGS